MLLFNIYDWSRIEEKMSKKEFATKREQRSAFNVKKEEKLKIEP